MAFDCAGGLSKDVYPAAEVTADGLAVRSISGFFEVVFAVLEGLLVGCEVGIFGIRLFGS